MQHTMRDELRDIAQRRVLRALREGGPLAGRQLPFESVEQPMQDLDLTLVHREAGTYLPEACLDQNRIERRVSVIDARPSASRNHASHAVTSSEPRCVRSSTS